MGVFCQSICDAQAGGAASNDHIVIGTRGNAFSSLEHNCKSDENPLPYESLE